MRAILVSVDYTDILSITLPYNRHHFDEVLVVTSPEDAPNIAGLCANNQANLFCTDAFYRDGATFNKWLALEAGLDSMGRSGWICLMDADVLWPKTARFTPGGQDSLDVSGLGMREGCSIRLRPGHLCTPRRRMLLDLNTTYTICKVFPPEERVWSNFPLHPQSREFAGYTQIFHASDPHLGPPPWHQTDWRHAGGADSFFQAKWPISHKIRPPFEVLHLGPAGTNWCGRVSPYLDGSIPPSAADRADQLRKFRAGRKPGPDKFAGERL